MEVKSFIANAGSKLKSLVTNVRKVFIRDSNVSQKGDVNFKAFKTLGLASVFVFVGVVFLLPDDVPLEFTEKVENSDSRSSNADAKNQDKSSQKSAAHSLWSSSHVSLPRGGGSQVNHNTSMILGQKGGNAKTQLRAGHRLPLRILDKVIISQDPVPVLAELLLDSQTDSGLKLPAGTKLYGEASFQRGSERASVRFTQLSLPSGQIRKISAQALGKDGQPGIEGRIFSDGMKNTAGQVLTTFVGGLASGSMETDILGRSKGGLTNGLLGAVSATAQSRAQVYGEKLKTEREWIELMAGSECDAVLNESLGLQEGGGEYE
ncbi:MAG: TrbI/VirB10 family protein [Bdellovibrionales bacterium]